MVRRVVCRSVAGNRVGETDYVVADKVQGDSEEPREGATVVYQGREMVVSARFGGKLKMIDMSDAAIVQLQQAAHAGLTLKFV